MPFQLQDLYNLRRRILDGEEPLLSEVTEMITFLRADREAKMTKAKGAAKEKKPEVDTEKLMNSIIG